MNANEFQDLQKFGTNIEKITDEIIKKEPKKKNNLKYFFKCFLKKIYTLLISFIKWMYIKIKSSFIKIKNWLLFKRDLRIIKRNFKIKTNKKGYSYKIVETKKQRGNKTVIIRKRVPFYFDINSYKSDLNNINGVFYLSEKDRNVVDSEYCFFVKKSIWDFPIEDKKFRDFVLFWRK
ncbi:MAG: hypothetical protein MUO82_04800 [Candidatus Thermoplasmatota archaeon]|nr:hypothetical protein [Candidatus Thermoplasmatota archaeon]